MPLTADQISDFRADIGDNPSNPVFTDDELNRLYTRASESYEVAVVYAIEQLMANATKLTKYSIGQVSQDSNQVFENLKKLRELWKSKVQEKKQFLLLSFRAEPPSDSDYPHNYRPLEDGFRNKNRRRRLW